MKIVTWNSQSKFAENFKEIKKQNADIYVIQECENPQITKSEEYRDFASNSIWVGDNKNYGLGIFAGDDVKLDLVDLDNAGLRYFIPVRVNDDFNLLGIWTNPDMKGNKVVYYPKEVTRYYELHKDSGFFNQDMVMCGDFNIDLALKNKTDKGYFIKLLEEYFSDLFREKKTIDDISLDLVIMAPEEIRRLEENE